LCDPAREKKKENRSREKKEKRKETKVKRRKRPDRPRRHQIEKKGVNEKKTVPRSLGRVLVVGRETQKKLGCRWRWPIEIPRGKGNSRSHRKPQKEK